MTTSDALYMIKLYARVLRERGCEDATLTELHHRFPAAGSEQKAMRWLGFMQGAVYQQRLYTVEQLAGHTRLMLAGDRRRLEREIRP